MKSPIKYYGGKGMLALEIVKYFPNDYTIYIEPFGGGGSVLFAKEQKGVEIYNDLGKNVYSLFKVLSNKNLFLKFKNKCDIALYSRQLHDEYKLSLIKDNLSLIDRAFKFFYVSRTFYNGVGGFSVVTNYIRRNMSKSTSDFLSSIDNLDKVHLRLSSVIIENQNALNLIDQYNKENVFMYLDPPYVHSTRLSNTKYEVEMCDDDHMLMVQKLNNFKGKFLLSGYENEIYNKLNNANKIKIKNNEILWKNY